MVLFPVGLVCLVFVPSCRERTCTTNKDDQAVNVLGTMQ